MVTGMRAQPASCWDWQVGSGHENAAQGHRPVRPRVPFSLSRFFCSTVCSPLRAFRNLIQTSGNSPFFTLLTDDFIKPRTVGQLPDSATSLVSLSILGKISILDKWEGCSSRLPRPRVPEGYAYLSTFRSFFPSSSF